MDLSLVAASHALGLLRSEDVAGFAAVQAGASAPESLRPLLNCTGRPMAEVGPLLERALRDLGVPIPTPDEAWRMVEDAKKRRFDLAWEKARRLLCAVRGLHELGYERLRAFSFLADGPAPRWKCYVVPVTAICREYGAVMSPDFVEKYIRRAPDAPPMPFYVNAMMSADYPWPGFEAESPPDAARSFVAAYPDIASEGAGADRAYADWYARALDLTAPRGVLYANIPGEGGSGRPGGIETLNIREKVIIAPPPPGQVDFSWALHRDRKRPSKRCT